MADNNSNDIILQEKFRNPITGNWDWAAPIKIQRDGTILLDGKLIAENAVGTNNIQKGAVTNAKLGENAVETNNIKDGAVSDGKLGQGAVGRDNIQNGAIQLRHFDSSGKWKIPAILLDDASNILKAASSDDDNNVRAVSSETIRRNAITHSKLFGSDIDLEGIGIDDQPPVWGENIKEESIQFVHIYNPYKCTKISKDWRPIDGDAHIAKRSIPLNKLSEPIYTLKDEGNDNYTLNLYHVNGDVVKYNNGSSDAWDAKWEQANRDKDDQDLSQPERDNAVATIAAINRWRRNDGKGYYINIYDPDDKNNNNEIWSWDYSIQEEIEKGIEEPSSSSSS